MEKKKLGIIGGMGSQAAAWIFDRIVALSPAQTDQEYLEILLHNNSAITDRTAHIIEKEPSPLPELIRSARLMNLAGVEVVVQACMTSYYYAPWVQKHLKATLMHPVQLVARQLQSNPEFQGLTTIGLIGSTGLLKSNLYQDGLGKLGFKVVHLPATEQQRYFMDPIYQPGGIKAGNFTGEVKQQFLQQFELLQKQGAQVVLGACSEVPLVVTENPGMPFIDVFELLCKETVAYCYQTSA